MDGVGGLVEFGQGGARDHGHRMPSMRPQRARREASLQSEFEPVVAALRGAALIRNLGDRPIGKMAARTHRRGHRLDVAAGLGVNPPAKVGHPVAALRAEHDPAPPCPIGLVVVTVGIEDRIDLTRDGLDDLGIIFARLAHQTGLDLDTLGARHT
jgi:hypothetical protein